MKHVFIKEELYTHYTDFPMKDIRGVVAEIARWKVQQFDKVQEPDIWDDLLFEDLFGEEKPDIFSQHIIDYHRKFPFRSLHDLEYIPKRLEETVKDYLTADFTHILNNGIKLGYTVSHILNGYIDNADENKKEFVSSYLNGIINFNTFPACPDPVIVSRLYNLINHQEY